MDPEGKKFPWRPPTLNSLLKGTAMKQDAEVILEEQLEGKYRALYFSAHWV